MPPRPLRAQTREPARGTGIFSWGYINLVPPGLYGDPRQDRHLREVSAEEAEGITFFMYEELLAVKRAAARLGLSREDIEKIFFGNADKLIRGARESIFGA